MRPFATCALRTQDSLFCCCDKEWRIILLRYSNPVGAHPSGASLARS